MNLLARGVRVVVAHRFSLFIRQFSLNIYCQNCEISIL